MKIALRMAIMLVLAALVFGGVFGFDTFKSMMIAKFVKGFANPSQYVVATTATLQPWQAQVDAVATLRAVNGADLSTDVDGIVDEIDFKSGDDVQAGTVLLRLRTEDDAARLRQLQSALQLAQNNYQRDLRQLQAQAVSRATVDSDLSSLRQAQAAVAQQNALIAKKTVVAPFAGHLGIRLVDQGQYLAAGTAIVTLQALDPIFADFYIPQEDIAQIRIGQAASLQADAYPGHVFDGRIVALNAKVDTATRTLQVRAEFANPNHLLLPGMFARATVAVGAPRQFITLPQTAIAYNPYGSTAFLIVHKQVGGKDTQVAQQTFVQTGLTRGDQIAVTSGIDPGQTVVVAGTTKLHNGTPVTINNAVTPLDNPNPHPAEE
jgi:membrane fusion protein (multidrug efflux system)